jgi:hypothetical protein
MGTELTITHDSHTYEAELSRGPSDNARTTVTIYRDDHFSGKGWLSPTIRIEDCGADLPEEVYTALEAKIRDAFARGVYAELDPS